MLENQQSQLVAGLQELYKRVQTGQGWAGSPLKETSHGGPLTHDILERLRALKQEDHSEYGQFEENQISTQQRHISNGAGYMQRANSTDSNSETSQSPIFEQMLPEGPELMTLFRSNSSPPTPPHVSPCVQSTTSTSAPSHLLSSSQSQSQSTINPVLLHRSTLTQPPQNTMGFNDNMAFINRFEIMPALETLSPHISQPNINVYLPMWDWQDESEESSRFFNPTTAA